MAIEGRRDTILYKIIVPVVGAILGAVAATWLRASNVDNAQLTDVIALIKDPTLTGPQKLQALEIYKEITDRPWAILRTLVTSVTFAVGALVGWYTVHARPRQK